MNYKGGMAVVGGYLYQYVPNHPNGKCRIRNIKANGIKKTD